MPNTFEIEVLAALFFFLIVLAIPAYEVGKRRVWLLRCTTGRPQLPLVDPQVARELGIVRTSVSLHVEPGAESLERGITQRSCPIRPRSSSVPAAAGP